MSGMIKEANLRTPKARTRLKRGKQPHMHTIAKGRALGYRRLPDDAAGRWLFRLHVCGKAYRIEPLGLADDAATADGRAILSFEQAKALAEKRLKTGSEGAPIEGSDGPAGARELLRLPASRSSQHERCRTACRGAHPAEARQPEGRGPDLGADSGMAVRPRLLPCPRPHGARCRAAVQEGERRSRGGAAAQVVGQSGSHDSENRIEPCFRRGARQQPGRVGPSRKAFSKRRSGPRSVSLHCRGIAAPKCG